MRRLRLAEVFFGEAARKIKGLQPEQIKQDGYLTRAAAENFRESERLSLNKEKWLSIVASSALVIGAVVSGVVSERNDDRIDRLEQLIDGEIEEHVPNTPPEITRTVQAEPAQYEEYQSLNGDQTKWQIATFLLVLGALAGGANARMAADRRERYSTRTVEVVMHDDNEHINVIEIGRTGRHYHPKPVSAEKPSAEAA